MGVLRIVVIFLRTLLGTRAALAAENLALRHQLGVLQRSVKRPKFSPRDRLFWVVLSRLSTDWRSSLALHSRTRSSSGTGGAMDHAADRRGLSVG